MAEIFKFFNSAPGDERWHYASDFADYFGSVLTSGLLHENGSYGLQATVNSGTLTTNVAIGKALIKGYSYENTNNLTLTHSLPEQTLDRIDRIVLRLDLRNANRFIKAFVKEGASATNPIAPDLQRGNYVYELSLATVRVRANTSSISVNDITDTRALESVCGIVQSLITVPTSVFQQQFDAWFDGIADTTEQSVQNWQTTQEQAFSDWFATIQNTLDGDVATNLANQITMLNNKVGDTTQLITSNKNNLVGAVNELFTNADDGKTVIANAIVGKGGTASKTDTFGELATAINNISTGKKFATGNFKGSGTSKNTFSTNANFTIRLLIIYWYNENRFYRMVWDKNNNPTKDNWYFSDHITYMTSDRIDGGNQYQNAIVVSNNLVTLTCGFVGTANVSWEAFE